MSADLETGLREAFDARAATTTTSPDAWARVNHKVDRHDHRRSIVLRVAAAAAAVVVLVAGGGVVLLRDRNGRDTTVATSRAADDAAGGSAAERSDAAAVAPFVPVGGGLELQRNADGTIVARLGDTTTPPVQPDGISAAIEGRTLFGVVPAETATVDVGYTPSHNSTALGAATPFSDATLAGSRMFRFELSDPLVGSVSVSARDGERAPIGRTQVGVEAG